MKAAAPQHSTAQHERHWKAQIVSSVNKDAVPHTAHRTPRPWPHRPYNSIKKQTCCKNLMRLMRARAVKWISRSVGRQAFYKRIGFSLTSARCLFLSPIIKFIHTPHAKSPKCIRARQNPASCAAFCLLATRFARSPSRARSRLFVVVVSWSQRCQSYGEYSRCRRPKMYATFSRPRRPRYVNCKSCAPVGTKNEREWKKISKILMSPRLVFTFFLFFPLFFRSALMQLFSQKFCCS